MTEDEEDCGEKVEPHRARLIENTQNDIGHEAEINKSGDARPNAGEYKEGDTSDGVRGCREAANSVSDVEGDIEGYVHSAGE